MQETKLRLAELKRFKLQNGDVIGIVETCSNEELEEFVVNAGVSLDSSWSSRGFSARDGLVAAISVDTGKVLDAVFLSNSCGTCTKKESSRKRGKILRMEFLARYILHEPSCYLNHDGSS